MEQSLIEMITNPQHVEADADFTIITLGVDGDRMGINGSADHARTSHDITSRVRGSFGRLCRRHQSHEAHSRLQHPASRCRFRIICLTTYRHVVETPIDGSSDYVDDTDISTCDRTDPKES